MSLLQNRLQSIYRQLADSLIEQQEGREKIEICGQSFDQSDERYILLPVSSELIEEIKSIREGLEL